MGQVETRPGGLPDPPVPVPAVDRGLEGDARDPRGSLGERHEPAAVVERRTRDIADRSRAGAAHASSQLAASAGRPAPCAARTPVTTKGVNSTRSSTGTARVRASRQRSQGPLRITGLQGDLRQAPQRRQDELGLLAPRSELERVGQDGRSHRRARPRDMVR